MKREKRAEASREEHGSEEKEEEKEEEGWSTTRRAERSECPGEGEVKEESRRERRREEQGGKSGQKGNEEQGGEEEEEEEREGKRRPHGHRKSGAFLLHAKSSDGGVCSHPRDVATKRAPFPFKSLLPTISSCSPLGRELETRQKSFCHRDTRSLEQT